MSLARGRFGIEYNPNPRREESSGLGCLVLVILAIAAMSFTFHAVRARLREKEERKEELRLAGEATPDPSAPAPALSPSAPDSAPDPSDAAPSPSAAAPAPRPSATNASFFVLHSASPASARPTKVQNLLLRLEEAEKTGNIEMAVSTIEDLRPLPGAADLDDTLARRVGELNVRWLFELANRQWVTEATVRPGESASRIATAHGATLASLVRLNGLADANNIRPGQTLKVMKHPRFSLTVHRRARFADLHLNGKFFRRYDLLGDVSGDVGLHPFEAVNLRAQFRALGLDFSPPDRAELETLLPKSATIVISET